MDEQQVLNLLESKAIEHLWVIWHDLSGRSCTKTVSQERFSGVFKRGVVFAKADLDFNLEDHMAPGSWFTAETGDFLAVPDPATFAVIPYHPATGRMYAFLRADDGSAWEGCPRTQLQKIVEAYASEGMSIRVAFESEFTLFSAGDDGEYLPADMDGMFTVAGLDRHFPLWQNLMNTVREMGVQMEQMGKEYGPGQYEATFRYAEPLKAVDDYLTFKEVVRALARQAGWVATFMPKPYAHLPGNGLHVHLSLWDLNGQNDLSKGETDEQPLSKVGRNFLAGLLAHAPALAGAGSPIVNSYKRLLPGSWSPAHICWGVGNRAALVRVPSMGKRRRIEYRSGDNACNPFIYLTSLLCAGLDGIHNRMNPPAPVSDDVGHVTTEEANRRGLKFLPRSLPEALGAFETDAVLRNALGPVIFEEFLKVKRSELEAYNIHVHPWERDVYLESI